MNKLKIILSMCFICFPLSASGQCLLEKLYALVDSLRIEAWMQTGVPVSRLDSLTGWPDSKERIMPSFEASKDLYRTHGPHLAVYAFIGKGSTMTYGTRIDSKQMLCRWNEYEMVTCREYMPHTTYMVYNRSLRAYFDELDKQQIVDTMRVMRKLSGQGNFNMNAFRCFLDEEDCFIAWLKPDFTLNVSFLYYGDSTKYMNPEEWRWDRFAQVGDTLRIWQDDSIVVLLTREDWESRSNLPFGGDTTALLCPEENGKYSSKKKRWGWKFVCYTEPTVIKLNCIDRKLYVKDTMIYCGYMLDSSGVRPIPLQDRLDAVTPSFAEYFNGLGSWRSIPVGHRHRVLKWVDSHLNPPADVSRRDMKKFKEIFYGYNGRFILFNFPMLR